jgi:hypothetical protein
LKKYIVLAALCAAPLFTFGQEKEIVKETPKGFIKEMSVGCMIPVSSFHEFTDTRNDVTGATIGVSPSFNILTKHTHNSVMLGVFGLEFRDSSQYKLHGLSIQTLNGWILRHNWGIYFFYGKDLNTPDAYGSVGIEKVIEVAPTFEFILFGEVGTDWFGTQSIAFGVTSNISSPLRLRPRGHK